MATPNNPSAISGTMATNVVSALDLKPQVMNTLFRRYSDQGLGFFEMMKSLGYTKPVANSTYFHFEEDFIHEVVHVGAVVTASTGAGTAFVFKLDAAQDIDANQGYYIQVGQSILLPNDVVCRVTDITVNGANDIDVTVVPSKAADNINSAADVPVGTEIMIFANGYAEGTDQPRGAFSKNIRDEGYLSIIKATHEITGTEMNSEKFWSRLSDGKSAKGSFAKGAMDTQYLFALKTNMALLFEEPTDNPLVTGNAALNPQGREFKTTEGLIPFIRRCGNTIDHSNGSWSVAKFDQIERILDKEINYGDVMMFMGLDLAIENSNVLKDYLSDTNSNYISKKASSKLFGGDEGLTASVDFSGFHKNGRDYYFKKMPVFTHPRLGGAAGYEFKDRAVVLPLGMRKAQDPTGQKVMLPSFGCRYSSYDHNRMVQSWVGGAAGPDPSKFIGETDEHKLYFRANIGFEGVGGNSMILIEEA